MELKLIVLAGAKQGLEIPLKKDKFLIGRAKECALRAGSEAISRRHCAIVRRDEPVDGARSGQPQRHLRQRRADHRRGAARGRRRAARRSAQVSRRAAAEKESKRAQAGRSAKARRPRSRRSRGSSRRSKTSPTSSSARSARPTTARTEDDISRWLLGLPETNGEANLKETRTIRMEETQGAQQYCRKQRYDQRR